MNRCERECSCPDKRHQTLGEYMASLSDQERKQISREARWSAIRDLLIIGGIVALLQIAHIFKLTIRIPLPW